jgi:hypothetical protein
MKKISVLLAVLMLTFSVVGFASQFSDVPAGHWSYDALDKLAKKGILQGYPNGTFKGRQIVTRFDMAMATAKLLASVEQLMESGVGNDLMNKEDFEDLERLAVAFADELALLGVKITTLQNDMKAAKEDISILKNDVAAIKDYIANGGMEKVKLSGDFLVRHNSIIHKNDWANNPFQGPRAGNIDNVYTELQFGLTFEANVDDNIKAVARWYMLSKNTEDINGGQTGMQSTLGMGGIGNVGITDSFFDLAYLQIKDMFRFGGDFIFGRNFYNPGHKMLLNAYVDAIRYEKKSGDINIALQSIYDRHRGNYKDNGYLNAGADGIVGTADDVYNGVDFRNVWNLDFTTDYKDHDLYLGLYWQDDPNLVNRRTPTFVLGNTVAGQQSKDKRFDIEFGSKGPLGDNKHWSYDLGFVYTNYELDIVKVAAPTLIDVDSKGWMAHGAVKWDGKNEWAAKLSYTMGDDESMGAYALANDQRYFDGSETPYEDISRGNTYFNNGLMNMYDLKLQVEYQPKDSKHYFRVVGDWLDELDDTVENDLAKIRATHTNGVLPAGYLKNNTAYDTYNNLGISDPKALMLTFEYRYQLTENTRIRVGYTNFDLTGAAQEAGFANGAINAATPKISAGRGFNNDYDYNMFWAEIYGEF